MTTKTELYLAKIAGKDVFLPPPDTRTEAYLAKLAGMELSLPEPVTKEEVLLYLLAKEGLSPDGIIPSGILDITSNGPYDVTEYESVNVNVPASGLAKLSDALLTEVEITNTRSDAVWVYGGLELNDNTNAIEGVSGSTEIPSGETRTIHIPAIKRVWNTTRNYYLYFRSKSQAVTFSLPDNVGTGIGSSNGNYGPNNNSYYLSYLNLVASNYQLSAGSYEYIESVKVNVI